MTVGSADMLAPKITLLTVLVLALSPNGSPAMAQADNEKPDERSLAYRYDEQLGWFPKSNDQVSYTGTRTIDIAHNDIGFRDKNHPREKTKPRIAFIGDSFVWGYDVQQDERFTDLLQAEVPAIEVLNFGVSGYGTDQSYLLLQKYFDIFQPDAVVYLFSATDIHDNRINFNHRAYYKPYYVVEDGELELRGVPVPRSSVWTRWMKVITDSFPRLSNKSDVTPYLISALDTFVKSKGASFAVGLIDEHAAVRTHLGQEKIVFFDLTHIDQRYRYPGHGFHWTPEGHQLVARALKAFLLHNSQVKP